MRTISFRVSGTLLLAIVLTVSSMPWLTPVPIPVAHAALTISKSSYYDKTLAGILGQVGGFLSGYEFVQKESMPDEWFRLTYGPYSGDSPYWSNTTYPGYDRLFADGRVGSDDDYHVDFFSQHILDVHGPNVSFQDIKDEWRDHQIGDWGAGDEAMKRINEGMLPPMTGKAEFNRFYWVTEAYIETETLGMVAPGMPQTARDLTEKFGSVLSDFDSLIWGKYLATMYSIAYFETDVRVVVDKAAPVLPINSWPYQLYQRVKHLHAANPNDWRWAAAEIKKMGRKHYQSDNDMALGDINNGLLLISLLYGNNDYMTTAQIASLSGYDADCTASGALGLMGIIKGMAGTPDEIKTRVYASGAGVYINDLVTGFPPNIKQNYPAEQLWIDLATLYQRNAEDFIVARGGSIGTNNYTIIGETVSPDLVIPVANYDFEQGSLAGWASSHTGHAFAENNGTAQTGNWKGTIWTDSSVNDVRLYTTLRNLEPGATYRVSAYIHSNQLARLYADNYGGPYVYAEVVNTHANTFYEWVRRSVEFTVSGSTATVGLHMPPGPSGWAAIDNLYVQKITNPGKIRYEAENASRSGGQVRTSGSASNGSYVGGLDFNGNYVQFAVNVSNPGEYRMAVNYANGWSTTSRLHLYLNNVLKATISFPRTGAWGTFSRNIIEVPVELQAGSNTIKLQRDGDTGYTELDYIEISAYPAPIYGTPPLATNNLIRNPGFEDGGASQIIHQWSTWPGSAGTHADADYTETGSQTGSLRGTHYKATPYEVYTYQTITGISNGTYTLRAWVVSGGGQYSAFMSAKWYGDNVPELKANIPGTGWPNWSQITISNINVTSGQITVGFYSNAPGGTWLSFDNVELYRQE
jgi:hypothetical protein